MDEVWEYVEPHESGGTVYVTMTKQQAIAWMRNVYKDKDNWYDSLTDEQIFEEWVIVNWAYKTR
jgi:hypothetical protein